MVVKIDKKTGTRIHSPPYTKAEQDDFYRRVGGGPVTVYHSTDAHKGQKAQKTAAAVAGKGTHTSELENSQDAKRTTVQVFCSSNYD